MFKKILIANRGDNRRLAAVAAQAHVDAVDVMPEPDRGVSEANGDGAAETSCSRRY
jgi:acetyl/propionyl-CoA carboxylase alpha subunit